MYCEKHGEVGIVKSWQSGVNPFVLHIGCVECHKEKLREALKREENKKMIDELEHRLLHNKAL